MDGIARGWLADVQLGALAMAWFLRGLPPEETAALTRAMAASGTRLAWDGDRPVVDKHSTGGVGDKVSLILAPIVAACGAAVPMIAGRGLGHTGGTVDKLEAIPGYDTAPDPDRVRRVVRDVGCAIIGQTEALAPADRRLYAVRDATGTVESVPLITASILSKKLAAGIGGLVMDVKWGSGAFMPARADAAALAESLVAVGRGAGLEVRAVLSDMNQVLGRTAGHAVEVREAIDHLTGAARGKRLHALTLRLAAEMLVLAGIAPDLAAGEARAVAVLDSGAAAEQFARMVTALGGPADLLERPDAHLAAAPVMVPVYPDRAGYLVGLDVRRVGLAVAALGGGRRRPDDRIDPAVGFSAFAGLGEAVGPDRPIATCHARTETAAATAARRLRGACDLADQPGDVPWVLADR